MDLAEFKTWLETDEDTALAERTVDLYVRSVELALRRGDPMDVFADESLGISRKQTYRRALLHWARFTGDEELGAKVRAWKPSRRARKTEGRRKKGEARALDLDTEWSRLRAAIWALESSPLRGALGLLATSGLRLGEVLGLTREHLEALSRDGSARITQKGGRPRYAVVVVPEQIAYCRDLLEGMPRQGTVLDALTTRRRKSRKGVEAYLTAQLRSLAESCGIEAHVHPHALRRTVGDAVYRATGSLPAVQDCLGRASIEPTARYYQDHAHLAALEAAMKQALG